MTSTLVPWRSFDASPFGLSLGDAFRYLDAQTDSDNLRRYSQRVMKYPPHNQINVDDTTIQLQYALAGFSRDEIEVSVERGILNITAKKSTKEEVGEYLHRGIASRDVDRDVDLKEYVVDNVAYTDGLLTITLRLDIPEQQKKKVLPIS